MARPRVRVLPLLTTALGVSACTVVGPDFRPPSAPELSQWQETAGPIGTDESRLTREPGTATDWWTVFGDPVLDRLIVEAYAQNLTLRTAGIRIYEARAQLGIAIGEQYPQQQQVGAGYRREAVSKNLGVLRDISNVISIDPTFNVWELGFDAAWELDLWGKFRRGIESADANLLEQVANYDDVLVTLTGDVASAYTQIRTFEERLVLARRNVALQKRSLAITRLRFADGVATELDVQEATALLNKTEALVPELENGLRQSMNALTLLLGLAPGELGSLLGGPGEIPKPPEDVAVGIPSELLRRRPDIRAAEMRAAAQSAQIGFAEADLYPAFTLAGSIGFQSSDLSDLLAGRSVAGFFNPGVTWNVFNYGRIKNNVRVQDARLQELIVDYQNTVLKAYKEVEDAAAAFVQGQRQADFLAKSVAASERAVDIALLQYADGTADYTRVLNTQTSLVRTQDQLTAVRGQIVSNLVALYKALGGGWQIRDGRDFVPPQTRNAMSNRTDWGDLLAPDAVPEGEKALTPPPSPEPPTLFDRLPE